jgi:hypothetical protein
MSVGKADLTLSDLYETPVWYLDEETDKHYPVLDLNEGVASVDHFRFRAEFTTPAGDVLEGVVSGLGDVAISVFRNGRWYSVNKDWQSASKAQIAALIEESPELKVRSVEGFFPIRFRTVINKEPFIDRSGEFDL